MNNMTVEEFLALGGKVTTVEEGVSGMEAGAYYSARDRDYREVVQLGLGRETVVNAMGEPC